MVLVTETDVRAMEEKAKDPTLSQRERALAKGTALRFKRAIVKRKIKAGEVKASTCFRLDVPDWINGMKVKEPILAIDRIGEGKLERLCFKADVSPEAFIGDITIRARLELHRLLEERGQ